MDPIAETILAVIAALGLGVGAKPAYDRMRGSNGHSSVNGGPALSVLLEDKFKSDSELMVRVVSTQENTADALERVDTRLEVLNQKQDRVLSQNHELAQLHQNPDSPFATVEISKRIPVIETKLEALDRIEAKLALTK